ncbi:hypothetical protein G5B39_16120 (plasmid) [Rhodobacteraceae bacterium SC52]|nr:hypothetical protein G5B39_16120 [Rhodobacteraceae bacterium SC52]
MSDSPPDTTVVLLEDGPKKKRLKVTLQEYMGRPLLNLRYWYEDKKSGEMQPTRQGVALTRNNYLALRSSIVDHHDEIMEYLNVGAKDAIKTGEGSVLNEHISGKQSPIAIVKVEFEARRPASELYKVDYHGSSATVRLNTNHCFLGQNPTLMQIEKVPQDVVKSIGRLLVALDLSLMAARDTELTSPSVVTEQLKFDFFKHAQTISRQVE